MKHNASLIHQIVTVMWSATIWVVVHGWAAVDGFAKAIEWLGKVAAALIAISTAVLIGWEILHLLGYLSPVPDLPAIPTSLGHVLRLLVSKIRSIPLMEWP